MVGGQPRQFLTSLYDPQRFPAREIAEHYVQRWEIELGFREIKQGMLKNTTTLRSKLPELVRQEVWGMLIVYNLLRHEIAQMANELHVPPQRLSFQWLALAVKSRVVINAFNEKARFSPLPFLKCLDRRFGTDSALRDVVVV